MKRTLAIAAAIGVLAVIQAVTLPYVHAQATPSAAPAATTQSAPDQLVNKVSNMGKDLQKPVAVAQPQEKPPKASGSSGQMSLF